MRSEAFSPLIPLKLDRPLSSRAADRPVKFQSDMDDSVSHDTASVTRHKSAQSSGKTLNIEGA